MKESDHFQTPQMILQRFPNYFDPCPLRHDLNKWNGLKINWRGYTFVNPPYSEIALWLAKAREQLDAGISIKIVFLLPVWTDRAWFHDLVLPFPHKIEFIRGRVKFIGGYYRPTFPSMLLTLGSWY